MGLVTLIAIQAGLWLISYLLREDEEDDDGDRDRKKKGSTTVAEEGTAPPIVFGTARVRKTNIIMYAGGASFSDYLRENYNDSATHRKYYVDAQLGICLRPYTSTNYIQFKRIWFGDSLAGDGPEDGEDGAIQATGIDSYIRLPNFWGGPGKGGGIGGRIEDIYSSGIKVDQFGRGRIHWTYGQVGMLQDDPFNFLELMVANGPNRGPAPDFTPSAGGLAAGDNHGTQLALCTMSLLEFNVGERPVMPGISVEVTVCPKVATINPAVGGVENIDANPMQILRLLLTDPILGMDLGGVDFDTPSLAAAANTLDTENHGFSMVVEKPTPVKKLIEIIIKQIDGILYMDPEDSRLYVKLIREDYGAFPYPGLDTYDDDDVIEVVDYKETSWDDTFSQVRVKFEDRDAEYSERYAASQDLSIASQSGRTKSIDVNFPGVKTADLANRLAARELKFYSTPQLLVTLKLNRRGHDLRPGDVFKWTWRKDSPSIGFHIEDMVLRVHQVDLGTYDDGIVTVTCSRDKYSNVLTTFADPDRNWLDDYGDVAVAPDCFRVQETPPNPFFDQGGSDWTTPDYGILMVLASPPAPVVPPETGLGGRFGLQLSAEVLSPNNSYVATGDTTTDSTPCGSVGVAYSRTTGGATGYFDDGVGLRVQLSDSTANLLRTSTEDEVRAGRAVILVGDEYMSYESFTDLGGGSYRLNNVWRALFDTIAEDHSVDESVFLMSEVDMGRVTQQKSFACGQTISTRMATTLDGRRQIGDAPFIYSQILATKRSLKATRPTGFTMYYEGYDAVGDHRDVEYAFDVDDDDGVTIVPFVGDDAVTSAIDIGQVFTNDLRGDWRRRPVPTDCETMIVRGDDPDIPFPAGDATRLQVEGKRDTDDIYTVLQGSAFDGKSEITSEGDFLGVGALLPGPGSIRVCAFKAAEDTGEDLCSHTAEDVLVDMVPARQLLVNRKFRSFWNVNDPDGSGGFGSGQSVRGTGDITARGWRSIGGNQAFFGSFNAPRLTTNLEQGDGTQGHAVTAVAFTGVAAEADWVEVEQIIPVPYQDTDGSDLWAKFYILNDGASTDWRMTLEALDATGTVVTTVSNPGGTAGDAVLGARLWRKQELVLLAMGAAVTSLRLTVGIRSVIGSDSAISNISLFMGKEISGQLLGDEDFAALGSWNQTVGVWTNPGSTGPLTPLDGSKAAFLQGPAAGATGLIEQDVLLPAEFSTGDWIRVEFWTANTGGSDTIIVEIQARDIANGNLAQAQSNPYIHNRVDQWYAHQVYLQIPAECDDINIQIQVINGDAGAIESAIAEMDLRCFKADPRSTTFDYSVPVAHVAPLTSTEFEAATETPGVYPSHIFPMQDGAGNAPTDVLQGDTFDEILGVEGDDFDRGSEATGLMNAVNPVTDLALELSKFGGGIKNTDQPFLDPNNDSFGIYFQYRITGTSAQEQMNIISKTSARFNPVNSAGFQITWDGLNGTLTFNVASNFTAGNNVDAEASMSHPGDDAWHWAYFKYDTDALLLSILGDHDSVVGDALGTFVLEEFSNIVDEVFIGRNDVITGASGEGFDTPVQIRYMAVLRGKQSEKFVQASGDNLWTHGTDANAAAGNGLTYTRAQQTLVPISASHVATYGGTDSGIASPQVPSGFNPGLTGTNQLGLPSVRPIQNLVPFSEDMLDAAWTSPSATIAAEVERSPRGVREMHTVTTTALGGSARITVTGLAGSTEYTFSGYLKRLGANTNSFVAVTDNTLTTILVGANFATAPTAGRFTLTFTTDPGQTQLQLRLSGGGVVDSFGTTGYWGVMIQVGTEVYPIVLNPTATLNTSDATVQRKVGGVENGIVNADEGAMEVTYAAASVTALAARVPLDVRAGVGIQDTRVILTDGTGAVFVQATDGAGALASATATHPILAADTEIVQLVKWRAKTTLEAGAFKLFSDNGSDTQTDNPAAWVPGTGINEIHVGMRDDGAAQVHGVIEKIKFFTSEPTDTSF